MNSTTVGDSSFIVRNGEVTILESDYESSDCDDDSDDDVSNASLWVVFSLISFFAVLFVTMQLK